MRQRGVPEALATGTSGRRPTARPSTGVPPWVAGGHAQQHLDNPSELATRCADAGFRDALRAAPDLPALRGLLLRDAVAGPATP